MKSYLRVVLQNLTIWRLKALHIEKETANEIITSVLEHPSVLEVMRYLEEKQGFELKYINVKEDGTIDIDHLKSLMSDKVGLVTCMYVNNVMGQIQPIQDIADILKIIHVRIFMWMACKH